MQSTEPEIWKPVPEYEGIYEVSSHGRVRSVSRIDRAGRHLRGVVLRPYVDRLGYKRVALHGKVGGQKTRMVSHLVCEAFHGARPDGLQVCHNNGDASNDFATNLRWDTPSENIYDVVRHGHHHGANTTRCPRGHLLSGKNLIPSKLRVGSRECLACNRARSITVQSGRPFSAALADEKYAAIMAA